MIDEPQAEPPATKPFADHEHLDEAAVEEVVVQDAVGGDLAIRLDHMAEAIFDPAFDLHRAARIVRGHGVEAHQRFEITDAGGPDVQVHGWLREVLGI
ncbi:hypothetical protein D9M69_540720 [compost metagenome]